MADLIQETLGDTYFGLRLAYSPEPVPLGTAGALRLALPRISSPTVLLLNGDSYCDVNLSTFWDFHRRQIAAASLVLSRVPDTARFGKVHLTDERVARFEEKQDARGPGWINAGIYLIDRPLIETIPTGWPVSLEREMFPAWAEQGRLHGFCCPGRFLDIGTPQSYVEAEAFFPAA
jgi:NDP-sugar pyrophosphorylase family protein